MIDLALDEMMGLGYGQFAFYPDGHVSPYLPEYERLGTPRYFLMPVDLDKLDHWIDTLPDEPIALIVSPDSRTHEVAIYPAY